METSFGSIFEIGNIIFFLIVFMALAKIPILRQRMETHRFEAQTKKLVKVIERLELERTELTME